MKSKGVYDNSMIIITSDHGQAFNEHDFMYHGTYTYDELTNVPLIIKYPRGERSTSQGQGIRRSPTSIPSLRLSSTAEMTGRSTTKTAFAESYGFTHVLPPRYKHMKDQISEKLMQERRSVYRNEYKLTINVSTDSVEEFMFRGKDADLKTHQKAFKDLSAALKR